MFRRIARRSVVTVVVVAIAIAGLPSIAAAHDVVLLPDVHQVLHRMTNVEQAYKVEHCIVHFEFGTFGGTAYSFVRVTHEDRGYICTYATQVVGVREGDELINGPQSEFNCAARTPKTVQPTGQLLPMGPVNSAERDHLRREHPSECESRLAAARRTPAELRDHLRRLATCRLSAGCFPSCRLGSRRWPR